MKRANMVHHQLTSSVAWFDCRVRRAGGSLDRTERDTMSKARCAIEAMARVGVEVEVCKGEVEVEDEGESESEGAMAVVITDGD